MSSCSDVSSEDESDNECDHTSRKFEIAKMIDGHFDSESQGALDSQWSFVLDDGMFERQANFATPTDLWRHMQQIDATMTKLRVKGKKGVVRLFKSETSALSASKKNLWQSESSMKNGGKWVIRFSRKFKTDLSDFWVNLVVAAVSESMPRPDLVTGCVFSTRKGKTEMEVWMQDDPFEDTLSSGKKGSTVLSEEEQQLKMRELVGVGATAKTIQFAYKAHHKSHQDERQKKRDIERVKQVQQRKHKKAGGGNTWPYVQQASPDEEDTEKQLAEFMQQVAADPYEQYSSPKTVHHYNYDDDEDTTPSSPSLNADVFKYNYEDEVSDSKAPPSALLSRAELPGESSLAEEESPCVPTLPPLPLLPLEQLQQLQLQDLRLGTQSDCSDDDEHSDGENQEIEQDTPLNLASLRTRIDSTDVLESASVQVMFSPEPMGELLVVPTVQQPPLSPGFEVRTLYCCDDQGLADAPLPKVIHKSLLPANMTVKNEPVKNEPVKAGSPPTKLAMVLGTNPPDFSSPVMKAVMWRKRPRILSW